MKYFKSLFFVFIVFFLGFYSHGECSDFSPSANDDLNEGKWEYQRHQRKRMKWRQRQKEKKQEIRENRLASRDHQAIKNDRRENQSLRQRKNTERKQGFSVKNNNRNLPCIPDGIIAPSLDLTLLNPLDDFTHVTDIRKNDTFFQQDTSRKQQKQNVKKRALFDDPSKELIPLEGKILDVLKHNATKKNNYEDMCTLILRPWRNHHDKKAFLLDQWNDYMSHVTYETDNLLQSFAQFLLCRRYGDKKVLLPAIRHNLKHVLSSSLTHKNANFIRYHMSIDAIDIYLFSKKKEFLNVSHLYNARKFLKEMGEVYPIAAHYYVMFSLNRKLIHIWENDCHDPYDQRFLFNYYQRLLNLGFPETYVKSLVSNDFDITDRQSQRLLALFKEKHMMTNQEKGMAYRRYLKKKK